jgi:hypothetical protein
VLESPGLPESPRLVESELGTALLANLQAFLPELGAGLAFVARQARRTLDGDHFYVDLVFYHAALKCYVLIDLKVGELTHADLGQMQLYGHSYDRERRIPGDGPTPGLILCTDKNDAVVRYTLGEADRQIFASRHRLHLPTEAELAAEIRRERRAVRGDEQPGDERVGAGESWVAPCGPDHPARTTCTASARRDTPAGTDASLSAQRVEAFPIGVWDSCCKPTRLFGGSSTGVARLGRSDATLALGYCWCLSWPRGTACDQTRMALPASPSPDLAAKTSTSGHIPARGAGVLVPCRIVWSTAIVGKIWPALTTQRLRRGDTPVTVAAQPHALWQWLDPVMEVVQVAATLPGAPPPPMRAPRDGPLWNATLNAEAAYVVSHNTRHFPPPIPDLVAPGLVGGEPLLQHLAHGVESVTAIEFIEDILGLEAATLHGAPIPIVGPIRSGRDRQ